MCKTLVTTRTFTEPESLNLQWLNNTNVPRYIDYYFGGSAPTQCASGISLTTIIPEPVSKRKDTQYGIFNTDIFGLVNSSTDFEYKFRVNLEENNILSTPINDQCATNNNTSLFDLETNLPALFQPLVTNIENPTSGTFGIQVLDVFGVKYNTVTFPNKYCSLGFTYESGVLKVYYIYQDLTNCSSYSVFTYESDPLTVSGNVLIQFVKSGNVISFIINGFETIIDIDISHFIQTPNTYFGVIGFQFYETRFLYSSICSIYCKKDNYVLYSTDFTNYNEVRQEIIVTYQENGNTLTLRNYDLLDIQSGNDCCPLDIVAQLNNFKDGCCFTPTKEDNIRYKVENWFNNNFGFPYIADIEMMSKIGKSEESNRLLKLVNELNSFVFYLKSIRNKMICEEKSYIFFISDQNIIKFTEYFFVRGIDIKCLLEIMEIGNFKNCCGEVTPSVECTCKDELPSAIISADPYIFDRGPESDVVITYTSAIPYEPTAKVPFFCCDGSTSMEVKSELLNSNNLPLEIFDQSITTDGTFTYKIRYLFANSIELDSKEFYVQFVICGVTITRKHIYKCVDNCTDTDSSPVVSGLQGTVNLTLNDGNHNYTYIENTNTISIGNYSCCHQNQYFEILDVDTSKITEGSGLTILSPKIGEQGQGNIEYSYIFDGSKAINGTTQRLFIKYMTCGKFVHTIYVDFNIASNCVVVSPVFDPTSPSVDIDLSNLSSGTYYSDSIAVDYNCCLRENEFLLWILNPGSAAIFNQLKVFYGIDIIFPTAIKTSIGGYEFRIEYKFNREVWEANRSSLISGLPLNWTFNIQYDFCGNNANITLPIAINVTDTCAETQGSTTSTLINVDMYNPISNPVQVSTLLTVLSSTCNGTNNSFIYKGISNAFAKLTDGSNNIGDQFASPLNIPFICAPYETDLGDYTNPLYPVAQNNSDLSFGFPNSIADNTLAISLKIRDNFMRSSGNGIVSPPANKVLPISYDPRVNSNICFLLHITTGATLELESVGYANITVLGDIIVDIMPYLIIPISSGAVSSNSVGYTAKVLNCSFAASPLDSYTETIGTLVPASATVLSANSFSIPNPGFYWVRISHNLIEADLIQAKFNII